MNENKANIQWYPGHMAKTRRLIQENLALVDIAVEILDARIPLASRNPDIEEILGDKKEIIVLNKADLADEKVTKEWIKYFETENPERVIATYPLNSLNYADFKRIVLKMKDAGLKASKRYQKYGDPVVRAMILGVPNTGKSTFINTMNRSKKAKAEDRPGVTRGKQWVKTDYDIVLLDTPGILWPKFEDQNVGLKLALTGAIKTEILDKEELSLKLIEILKETEPKILEDRYKIQVTEDKTALEIFEEIGRKRGCIISKGQIDYDRVTGIVLTEFKGGKMGRLSLELPPK